MYRIMTLALVLGVVFGRAAGAAEDSPGAIPPPFVPFEHLVGAWKGTGIPAANRLKGWPERHLWAWKFTKGTPAGMSLTIEGGKILTKGQLSYNPAAKQYRLEGTDPAGKPVVYVGAMDARGKALELDRQDKTSDGGKDRLILRLNSNMIRYTMNLEHQEPGAPQFSRQIDMNLGKEGEAFAAGGAAASLPKCILTGGAATMSVTYEGKSYPLCCTGCRDEFLEAPAKYVKLALLKAQSQSDDKAKTKPVSSGLRKDDGAFEGLVDDPPAAKPVTKAAPKSKTEAEKDKPAPTEEPKAAPSTKPSTGADAASKAASLLRTAQSLEKQGKTSASLGYYRQIVSKYPDTPQAKTASERIKALGK
ncbi:MAG TPA: hypothetical protein VGZ22_18280 [Isosphaeraceae bacterium]|jgi:YHS domain-containing protein|nr:hypothetical protein [Isosphaeraceae bacterium]